MLYAFIVPVYVANKPLDELAPVVSIVELKISIFELLPNEKTAFAPFPLVIIVELYITPFEELVTKTAAFNP